MFIKNKIYLVLIISILIFSCLFASDFKPKIFDSNIIKKEYSHFTVYYNSKAKIPHCVYYKINHFETKYAKLRRFKNFRQDKELNTAKVTDYYKKGYDSGHLISAETASFCIDAAYDTNYMSNIAPQNRNFNRGRWKMLEDLERYRALKDKELYVVSGCIIGDSPQYLEGTNIVIPQYFYKVILDLKNPELKGIGFLMKNEAIRGELKEYATTIDEIEKISGIDFFAELKDDIENKLEGEKDWELWKKEKNSYFSFKSFLSLIKV